MLALIGLALLVILWPPPSRQYLCWGCGVRCHAEHCKVCRDEYEADTKARSAAV